MKTSLKPPRSSVASEERRVRQVLEEACELFESGNRSKAAKLFFKAAVGGSLEAQVNLGNIYGDGDGVTRSFDTARYWYKRAAARGSAEGAYNLAASYLNLHDARWAAHWFCVAKTLGHPDAHEQLKMLKR